MKKKLLIIAVLAAMLSSLFRMTAFAEDLTVYEDGTEQTDCLPVYGYQCNNYLKTNFIYPQTDLTDMEDNTITSMTFYKAWKDDRGPIDSTWNVYLAEVDYSAIPTSSGSGIPFDVSALTPVYTGTIPFTNDAETITFSTPYEYHGGNLMVVFHTYNKGIWSDTKFYGKKLNYNAAGYGFYSQSLDGIKSLTLVDTIPKVTFTYEPTPEAVTNIAATVAEPKIGETPATTVTLATAPENAVEPKGVVWYKVAKEDYKEDATWSPLDDGETFKTGYYYEVEFSFNVKEGFKLTDGTAGKVNGIDRKICKDEETGTAYLETTFDPLSYEIIEGKDGKWTKSATDPLTFRGNGAFAKFTKVNVDGKELDAANFDKSEGSTIIKLKAAYLETLSEGTHKLEMVWEDESAETTFTIEKKPDVPETGDNNGLFLWTLAMIGAVAAVAAAGIMLKKKEN